MARAGGFWKGESLSPILFSGPWVKESCVPAPEGGRLPAALGHFGRKALLCRAVITIFPDTSTGVPFLTVPLTGFFFPLLLAS